MKRIAYDQMYENELTHAWYIGTRELMLNQIKPFLKKDFKILDLGCGTGGTIKFLTNEGYRNIYGIDDSQYAINLCKKRGIKNVQKGSVNEIPFKDSFFDIVFCLDVLYHDGIQMPKVTAEISRVLKKRGIFYSQEPAYAWLRSKHDIAIETRTRFTKEGLIKAFSKSGLKNLKISYFNLIFFIPIAIVRLKGKIIKSTKHDSDVKELPVLLNKIMLFTLRIESAVMNHLSLPFGLSLVSVWTK